MSLHILVAADVEPRHLEAIRAAAPGLAVEHTTDRARLLALAPTADVIVGWSVPPEVVRRAERLRWIHSTAAGVDQLLFPELLQREVLLTSSSGIHAEPLSEHVLGVMLMLSRRLHVAVRQQLARRWDRRTVLGDELGGKTLGILGLGAIGRAIAERARVFGMRVIGTRRSGAPVPHVEQVFPPEGLDEVLRRSDVLVVVLPLTPATRGLIGARELALLPPGAFLINVGRGAIVQEAALVDALRAGRLAGAALDVFEQEPLPPESPLWDLPQVIITPHVSGTTPRYYDRAIPLFCENLRRFLRGEPLLNVVDRERGY
ncbi:MAG: D-2-hydroxyacid dehydrogenase [Armatimonadota bacterium]|nr:D-2-hydroxyacid dehydrogenase [Armatimonadota bacterium]MDR7450161.1 D-2-hydroxyacid dehydrogenase [Armatimonadota bacterium]MDR7460742.1 D-2-hydroxyacid dehydrogenase [Armatimonadota bacterium]MDR7479737.1 D-2-hydroxyacid dehydrogenase [Armatimonadota bacterium]MDR7489650.1 D-2-hydroxyacid dehydrogenase [Armatimonadota bacterium]